MLVRDAQREVRTVFVGGFYGQLVSSIIWFASAALATWVSPAAGIWAVVAGGFFIFPLTRLTLHLSGSGYLSRENPLHWLGMQVAFVLPFSMLLLVPVTEFRFDLFYPALMVLLGAHYIPFVFLYGMRTFIGLAAVLIAAGVLIAYFVSGPFAIGGWVCACVLFAFAWIARFEAAAQAHT